MNFDEMENLWRSPGNRPDATEMEKQKMNFIEALKKRRRAVIGLLTITAIPLAYFTLKIGGDLIWPSPHLDRVDWGREWAIIPFFSLPWIGWITVLLIYRRHRARHVNYESSIQASVRALIDENRTEQIRNKWIAGLLLVSVVVLPLIVAQLRAVGKAGDEILLPAFVIYPTYVLGTVAWMLFNLRRRLLPRQRELQEILDTYGNKG